MGFYRKISVNIGPVRVNLSRLRADESSVLSAADRAALFDMHQQATVRLRPVESLLHARAAQEEQRLINELRRPSEEHIRQGLRYAVWPILALHLSP